MDSEGKNTSEPRIAADLHTHTIFSGHAYSTMDEMLRAAAGIGLSALGISDHGPRIPGTPHRYYFENSVIWPREMHGVELLRGAEANILDTKGTLDLPDACLADLDFVIAGFHFDPYPPGRTTAEYTEAVLAAMENPLVDVIAHPGNPMYPIDYEVFVRRAVERGVLIEVNNSSLQSQMRPGSHDNCLAIARLARRYGAMILVSSDAHIQTKVGKVDGCLALLEEAGISSEQVVNHSLERLYSFLAGRGRKRFL